MIVASLLLVIAAAVTLLVGLLNRDTIEWVYASIACCLLAGLLLTIGVLRSRPSRKPVLQSGGEGQAASWAGASQWGSGGDGGEGNVLTRDDDESDATEQVGARALGDDDPTRTSMPAPAEPAAADDPSPWAPEDHEDTGDVRVVPPPSEQAAQPQTPPEPEPEPEPEPAPTPQAVADDADDADDDVVVVPKPSARAGGTPAQTPEPAAPGPAAKTGTDDAARFEQVLSPIPGVGAAKRAALLNHFGTYRKLRAATPEKLAEVSGISRTLADRIYNALHSK